MADEPDYYAELGLAPDADEAAIRQAYRQLARRFHPDVAGPGGLARMRALNAAYAVLGDPTRRSDYDQCRGLRVVPEPPRGRQAPSPSQPRVGSVRASEGPFARIIAVEAPEMPIAAVAFSGDGARIGIGLLDGRLLLCETPTGRTIGSLDFGPQAGAGVLQELRLSPTGSLVAAWGFSLGLRVWSVPESRLLWNTGISAPSDLVDVALADDPPFACLALPEAPLALASDDPFRWAHDGRRGTAVYYRPLAGPIAPNLANPLRCTESSGGGHASPGMALVRGGKQETWQVRARLLAGSGRALVTFAESGAGLAMLTRWDLMHRTLRGAIAPRPESRHLQPMGALHLPMVASSDLARVAVLDGEHAVCLFAPSERIPRMLDLDRMLDDPRLALASNGELLALAVGHRVEVWEMRRGHCLQIWELGAEVTALAFGADGRRAVMGVGLASGLVEVWGA
jgi:hypothetical protein